MWVQDECFLISLYTAHCTIQSNILDLQVFQTHLCIPQPCPSDVYQLEHAKWPAVHQVRTQVCSWLLRVFQTPP